MASNHPPRKAHLRQIEQGLQSPTHALLITSTFETMLRMFQHGFLLYRNKFNFVLLTAYLVLFWGDLEYYINMY